MSDGLIVSDQKYEKPSVFSLFFSCLSYEKEIYHYTTNKRFLMKGKFCFDYQGIKNEQKSGLQEGS